MNVYVSGPMRGYSEFNFPAFVDATCVLRKQGHSVFSPAERDLAEGFNPVGMKGSVEDLAANNFNLRKALAADCHYICNVADRIHMLSGWINSTGATAERALGIALGLEITGAIA